MNRIILKEKGAEVDMKSVTLNSSGCKQTFSVQVFHNPGSTKSTLSSYGIAANASKLKISTDGIIKPGCAKAETRQNTRA